MEERVSFGLISYCSESFVRRPAWTSASMSQLGSKAIPEPFSAASRSTSVLLVFSRPVTAIFVVVAPLAQNVQTCCSVPYENRKHWCSASASGDLGIP